MKKIFEGQKTGQEGKTELTTNMLAENLAPFSSENYEKELAIKCAQKKSELVKLGFNFDDLEDPQPQATADSDSKVPTLVPQESAATASTSQDNREQKAA